MDNNNNNDNTDNSRRNEEKEKLQDLCDKIRIAEEQLNLLLAQHDKVTTALPKLDRRYDDLHRRYEDLGKMLTARENEIRDSSNTLAELEKQKEKVQGYVNAFRKVIDIPENSGEASQQQPKNQENANVPQNPAGSSKKPPTRRANSEPTNQASSSSSHPTKNKNTDSAVVTRLVQREIISQKNGNLPNTHRRYRAKRLFHENKKEYGGIPPILYEASFTALYRKKKVTHSRRTCMRGLGYLQLLCKRGQKNDRTKDRYQIVLTNKGKEMITRDFKDPIFIEAMSPCSKNDIASKNVATKGKMPLLDLPDLDEEEDEEMEEKMIAEEEEEEDNSTDADDGDYLPHDEA